VVAAPLTTTDWLVEVPLITKYALLALGTVIVSVPAGLPVQLMI
jgi:hypothetical protein